MCNLTLILKLGRYQRFTSNKGIHLHLTKKKPINVNNNTAYLSVNESFTPKIETISKRSGNMYIASIVILVSNAMLTVLQTLA